jgi:hypothetical protein
MVKLIRELIFLSRLVVAACRVNYFTTANASLNFYISSNNYDIDFMTVTCEPRILRVFKLMHDKVIKFFTT